MSGVSSLLKSAQTAKQKIQDTNDAIFDYEYQLSAKSYNDFLDYQNYFQNRINESSNDVSSVLTYTKKIDSARSSYISNEIQRSTIDVIEGNGSNRDKYQKMVGLFYQAVDAGQYDLAQSLNLQLDNLSVTIQNEEEARGRAAQASAKTLAMNGVKSLKELNTKIMKGDELVETASGKIIKPLKMLEGELQTGGDTKGGFFNELRNTYEELQRVAVDTYNGASSQEAVDAIESQFGDLITGEKTWKIGGVSLTGEDIVLAAQSSAANNPLFDVRASLNETTGQQEFKLAKNKIDNFVWIVNDDGSYSAIQERTKVQDKLQSLDSKITDDGYFVGDGGKLGNGTILDENAQKAKGMTIGERLRSQGITATQNDDGTLLLTLQDGRQVSGAIQEDGSVRYFGPVGEYSGDGAGLYQIDILNGTTREVAPDETSDFGIESQFGGNLSQQTQAGKRYTEAFLGLRNGGYDRLDPSAVISTGHDFSGTGSAVKAYGLMGGLGGLQGTVTLKQKIAQDIALRAAQLAAAQSVVQGATTFDLNQTPIRQVASNGQPVKQLKVAPVKTPTISKVVVATPQKTLKVAPVKSTGLSVQSGASGFNLQGGGGF